MLELEDAQAKARRLSNEGVTLAEAERWWAAIGRWNSALVLTPDDHTIHEMLSQAYMQVWQGGGKGYGIIIIIFIIVFILSELYFYIKHAGGSMLNKHYYIFLITVVMQHVNISS